MKSQACVQYEEQLMTEKRALLNAVAVHGYDAVFHLKGIENEKPVLPDPAVTYKVPLEEITYGGHKAWWMNRKNEADQKVILYLHGGAYISHASVRQWGVLNELTEKTGAAGLLLVYPLAPVHTFEEAYAFLDGIYTDYLKEVPREQIILFGDSAGGGLALGYLQELLKRGEKLPLHTLLFSPWLDITMSEPTAASYNETDVMLETGILKEAGLRWAGDGVDLTQPKLSPMNGPLEGLCPLTVFGGTEEMFCPDLRKFAAKAQAAGVKITYIEEEGMHHDYVLYDTVPESAAARERAAQIIRDLS